MNQTVKIASVFWCIGVFDLFWNSKKHLHWFVSNKAHPDWYIGSFSNGMVEVTRQFLRAFFSIYPHAFLLLRHHSFREFAVLFNIKCLRWKVDMSATRYVLLILAMTSSVAAMASPSQSVFGGNVGYGKQQFSSEHVAKTTSNASKKDNNGEGDVFVGEIYYRYIPNDYFGIDNGILLGRDGIISTFFDATKKETISDVHYRAFRSALYGQYQLTRGNSLYAKLGANVNRVDYAVNNQREHGTGIGLYSAAGWQYRFRNGIGLNLEYQYVTMKHLTLKGPMLGVSYRF